MPTQSINNNNKSDYQNNNDSIKKWQMKDAQKIFRQVVKNELDVLLNQGWSRDDAVQSLLHRIVKDTQSPSDEEVKNVMSQFKMNRDDATRALIVKQELGRLKRRGLDPLEAIEELTCKMQGMLPLSQSSNGNEDESNISKTAIKIEKENEDDDELLEDDYDDEEDIILSDEDVPHATQTGLQHVNTVSTVFDAVQMTTPTNLSKKLPMSFNNFSTELGSSATTTILPTSSTYNKKNKLIDKHNSLSSTENTTTSTKLRTSELYHSKLKRRRFDFDNNNNTNNNNNNRPNGLNENTEHTSTLPRSHRKKHRSSVVSSEENSTSNNKNKRNIRLQSNSNADSSILKRRKS